MAAAAAVSEAPLYLHDVISEHDVGLYSVRSLAPYTFALLDVYICQLFVLCSSLRKSAHHGSARAEL